MPGAEAMMNAPMPPTTTAAQRAVALRPARSSAAAAPAIASANAPARSSKSVVARSMP